MSRRRARRGAGRGPGPRAVSRRLPGPAASGHIPFTPRAKKSLELSLREAKAAAGILANAALSGAAPAA